MGYVVEDLNPHSVASRLLRRGFYIKHCKVLSGYPYGYLLGSCPNDGLVELASSFENGIILMYLHLVLCIANHIFDNAI